MVSFHVAGAAGRDNVIIRIDFRDDDLFVLYVVCLMLHGQRDVTSDCVQLCRGSVFAEEKYPGLRRRVLADRGRYCV